MAVCAVAVSAQWEPLTSGTKASLRGLSSPGAEVAWASGSAGTILVTLDGGNSWKSRGFAGSEELDFRDVQAFDGRTAVVMSAGPGAKSRIYRTQDGGANWVLSHQNSEPEGFFDSMAFWDRKRGILIGDPVGGRFTVLTTDDGGKSWKKTSAEGSMPPANAGEGAFAASGTAVAVYKGGLAWFATGGEKGARVFRSNDYGKTWQVAQTPVRHDSASAGIFSVAFADARHGFAAGGDYRKTAETRGTLAITEDGGRTWSAATGLTGFRSAVALVGKGLWVATGPDGTDLSTDGGRTWKPLAGAGYHAISGRFASGFDGRIAILKLRTERN